MLDTGTGTGTEVKSGTVLVEIDPTSPNDHPIMTVYLLCTCVCCYLPSLPN